MLKDKHLPAVAGDRLDCSLSEFQHRARVYLAIEEEEPNPDNGLIALLCDAVRLAREYDNSKKMVLENLRKELETRCHPSSPPLTWEDLEREMEYQKTATEHIPRTPID